MNARQRALIAAAIAMTLVVGVAIGVWATKGLHPLSSSGAPTPAAQAAPNRPVLYWYDPMKPDQHFDKPGKSPFMDMALLPKYAESAVNSSSIAIDSRTQQNLGVRISTVELGELQDVVRATGTVQWNERQVANVQARGSGFVERVYGRAPGDVVNRGAPLVDLLIPEWAGAQGEFLAVRQQADPELLKAARERLRLLGMPDDLIATVENSGKPRPIVTITAPIAGVVQALPIRQGMTVAAGMTMAELRGIDPVWVEAAVPEAQAGLITTGAAARASLPAYPDQSFAGTVSAILPAADADTRALRVRVVLPNRGGRLKEGMFAQVSIVPRHATATPLVPTEAVIRTGTRTVVIEVLPDGHFQPTEVQIGRDAGGKAEVLQGLTAGQRVVDSGQFLIDSESSLRGALSRMGSSPADRPQALTHTRSGEAGAKFYEADGTIESITSQEIVLSHSPVRDLGWGEMTMPFHLGRPDVVTGFQVGERVHFRFWASDDHYIVERMDKSGSPP